MYSQLAVAWLGSPLIGWNSPMSADTTMSRGVALTEGMQWNDTSVLNILFLIIAAVRVIRFLRTGGPAMLKMMSTPEHEMAHHTTHTRGHHEMPHEQKEI